MQGIGRGGNARPSVPQVKKREADIFWSECHGDVCENGLLKSTRGGGDAGAGARELERPSGMGEGG